MVTLRCTQRVLKRLGASPAATVPDATTRLGDWYVGWVPLKKPLVLCMSERTLLAVIVPAAPIAGLTQRWTDSTKDLLTALSVPPRDIDAELTAMSPVTIAATADRRILGCLNEATQILKWQFDRDHLPTLESHQLYFADFMYSTIRYQHPRDLVRETFGMRPRSRPVPVPT